MYLVERDLGLVHPDVERSCNFVEERLSLEELGHQKQSTCLLLCHSRVKYDIK